MAWQTQVEFFKQSLHTKTIHKQSLTTVTEPEILLITLGAQKQH